MSDARDDTAQHEWRAALALLDRLLELEPEARLEALAASDCPQAVRERVRRMLEAEHANCLIDDPLLPLGAPGDTPGEAPEPGARLGRWQLLEALGRGGMSTVWRARSLEEPIGQLAALKRLDPSVMDAAGLRRFEREMGILATLRHPGVATILDAGRDGDGVPWFAMTLVDGEPIDRWCAGHAPDLRKRVDLLRQACIAVAHAHRHLVVHRDIKPGNVLVDGEGRVVLVDFGISRIIEEGRIDGAGTDATGSYAFTPRFAAPEQRIGGAISTATDLWGLGALAYFVLCGEAPVLADGAEAVVAPATLPTDLRAVLSHCLQRDPAERYRSADALADDLQALLDGRPVRARGDGLGYRAGRWLRRHPAVASLSAALVLSLLVGVAASLQQARRAEAEAARALAAQARAEAARREAEGARRDTEAALERAIHLRDYLVQVFQGSNPNNGPQASAAALLARGETMVEDRIGAGEPLLAADLLLVLGQARQLRGEYAAADALFERGLAVSEGLNRSEATATRAQLRFSRGEVARTQGRHGEARAHYAAAEALAVEGGMDGTRTLEYALARLTAESAAGGGTQPLDAMRAWLAHAEKEKDVPPALLLRGLDVYSTMLALAGTPDTGPLQERRLALAATVYADKPGWLAFAYADAVPSFRRWRAWDRAGHYAGESLRIVDANYDAPHVIPAIATCNAAGLALDLGRPDEALVLLDRTLAIDRALSRHHVHALSCLMHRAEARRGLGDPEGALSELSASDAMLDTLSLADDRGWRQTLCVQRVETYLQAGDPDSAWAQFERCGDPMLSPKARLLVAERALGSGDVDAAAAALDGDSAWAEPPPRDAPAGLERWLLALAVADARGDADTAARRAALREAIDAMPRPWAAQAHWRACLANDATPLLRCLPGR